MRRFDDLLQHVLRDPWADAPRHAYAAALADVDPDRARFIRRQLEAAVAMRAGQWHAWELRDAIADAAAVRRAHPEWTPRVPWAANWTFGRGFPEGVTVDARRFADDADALFREAPVLDLSVTGLAGAAAEFADSAFLSRLRSLKVVGRCPAPALLKLLASPFLTRLRQLDLSYTGATAEVLDAVFSVPFLDQLRHLGFDGNPVPHPGWVHVDEDGVHASVLAAPDQHDAFVARYGEHPVLTFQPWDLWVDPVRFTDQFGAAPSTSGAAHT